MVMRETDRFTIMTICPTLTSNYFTLFVSIAQIVVMAVTPRYHLVQGGLRRIHVQF